jgi:glycosyltransferase involved in cell wall biosynthesis
MRVCYYFRHLDDPLGRGVHARSLVAEWARAGHEVVCLPHAPAPQPPASAPGRRRLISRRVPRPLRHRLMQAYDELRGRVTAPELVAGLDRWDADVLIARWTQFDSTLDTLAAAAACPVVAEVNAVIHTEMERLTGARLPRRQVRRELSFLRGADLAVCVSAQVRDELVGLGVDHSRTAVVPNGVDCSLFRPDAPPDAGVVAWAADGGRLVAYCGTASLVHDMAALVAATETLADATPEARFLFVGPLEPELAPLLERRPDLAARVRVTGPVAHEAVPALLAPAAVLWTAFAGAHVSPLKELEYMALGKPVVVAGEGPATELVETARCGTAVAIGDRDGLARATADLLRRPEVDLRALGAAGRAWVTANASWSVTAEAVLELVRERLLGGDQAGAPV